MKFGCEMLCECVTKTPACGRLVSSVQVTLSLHAHFQFPHTRIQTIHSFMAGEQNYYGKEVSRQQSRKPRQSQQNAETTLETLHRPLLEKHYKFEPRPGNPKGCVRFGLTDDRTTSTGNMP